MGQNSKFKIKVLSFYIYALFLFWTLCFGNCNFAFAQDKMLAIVNNEIITQKDLDDFVYFMHIQLSTKYNETELQGKLEAMKTDLLERLIQDRLILQEAKREKIEIDKNRIKSKINQIKEGYSSDSQFQEALRKQGLTQADIEKKIMEQLLIFTVVDLKVKSKIIIHPQEVNTFYEEHIQDFMEPEQREVCALVSKNLELANNVLAAIKKEGADLNKAAFDFSLQINDLGLIKKGQLKKEIEEAIFKIGLNENSDLVNIDNEYYIFNIKRIVPPKQAAFNEVSDKIYSLLFEKKLQEKLNSWLDEIKKRSYIKIKKD